MFASPKLLLFIALSCCIYSARAETEDAPDAPIEDEEGTTETLNDTDLVPQDLYVIKTIVYEVGILTDASNDTDNLNQTQDQVDVSFFNPSSNGSDIDLSNIPLPVQTNVSGVSVTGLLPKADLASILLPPGLAPTPVLPKKQVTVTQNISTTDPDKGSEIIANLPKLLGLTKKGSNSSDSVKDTSTEKKEE